MKEQQRQDLKFCDGPIQCYLLSKSVCLYFQTWECLGMQETEIQDDEEHLKGTLDRCSLHRTGHTQIKMSRRLDRVGVGAVLTFLIDMAAMSSSSQLVTGGFKSLTGSLGKLIPATEWAPIEPPQTMDDPCKVWPFPGSQGHKLSHSEYLWEQSQVHLTSDWIS